MKYVVIDTDGKKKAVDPSLSFRNKIINGNFDVWQRGTSQTNSGYGSADRWQCTNTGTTKVVSRQAFTLGQTEVPGNPKYFIRHVVTSVSGASNFCVMQQKIEDVAFFGGKTVTVSFWAKANSAKNIAIDFYQNFGTSGSTGITDIGLTSVALTTAWKKYAITITLPSVSGKTIGANDYLDLRFWFDCGSAMDSSINTLIGQQSGTFDIAQVQLEEGTVATPFEQRPIGLEVILCQRYFEPLAFFVQGYAGTAGDFIGGTCYYKVTKRTTPTVTIGTVTSSQGTGTPQLTGVLSTNSVTAINVAATQVGPVHTVVGVTADAEL